MSEFPWSWMLLQIVLNHKNFIKRLLECFCHGKFQFIDIKCQLPNLIDTTLYYSLLMKISHLPKFWTFSCFCSVVTLRCECPVYNWSDPTPWRNNHHQEHLRGLWLWQPSSLLNKCWASTLQLWNTVLHALNHHTNSR